MPKKRTKPKPLHWEVIDAKRRKLLPKLAFVKKYGFYLAGGTGLALQLGHRTSVDFDFYTAKEFDESAFERELSKNVKTLKIGRTGWQTLIAVAEGVDISFFYYDYPLLEPLIKTEHINILQVPDTAAMKLIALSDRGLRRDFLDLYFIARQYGLDQIFRWLVKKFPQYDPHFCIKALTYFVDADRDKSGRGMQLTEPVSWTEVKIFFGQEARRLVKIWL